MKWVNKSDLQYLRYELQDNSECQALLLFDKNATYSTGTCIINGEKFLLVREGFWNSRINLINSSGRIIAVAYNEKSNANRWRLQINNKNYFIRYKQLPFFEIITEDFTSSTIFSYSLMHNDENPDIKIEILAKHVSGLLYMLIINWYIMIPLCIENSVDGIGENR